jgi:hypothetical protein
VNWRESAGKLARLQRTRGFKLVATGLIAAIALLLIVGAVVQANRPVEDIAALVPDAPTALGPEESITNAGSAQRMLTDLLGKASTPTGFIMSVLAVAAVLLATVWLGVGLTYLGMLSAAALVIVPLAFFPSTRPYATFAGGVSSLALSFTVLLQAASVLLGARGRCWRSRGTCSQRRSG